MYYQGIKDDPSNHSMNFIKKIGYHDYQKFDNITDINYVKSLYAGEVSYVDNQLGKLFAKLEELKIFDSTLVVFLSDHGESLFEHHVYIGHGIFLFDNEVKIPLIIKPAKSHGKCRVIDDQVESIDVMPTILDLLDLPESKDAQGKSLARLIKDRATKDNESFAFGESSNTGGTGFVRTNKWKFVSRMKIDLDELIQGMKPSTEVDLSTYIIDQEQLYDLENDPVEMNNLVEKEKGVANELRKELQLWEENNRTIALRFEKLGRGPLYPVTKPELTEEEKEQLRALGYAQ
jgi:arylsulfatase A-like enzyme